MDTVIKELIFAGANPHMKTTDHETPLALAQRMGNFEATKILGFADSGANTDALFLIRDFPWMHGKLNRQAAEHILEQNSYSEGLFLVRESSQRASDYVLSMCQGGNPYHYQIQADFSGGRKNCFFIDDGPVFEGLPRVIEYYRSNADGLPSKLKQYCRVGTMSGRSVNLPSGARPVAVGMAGSGRGAGAGSSRSGGGGGGGGGGAAAHGGDDSSDDDADDSYNRITEVSVRDLSIDMSTIKTGNVLGEGEFGQVLEATWKDKRAPKGKCQVACKTLRDAGAMKAESHAEFLREAKLMEKLQHIYVVRLFGYVWGVGNTIAMIVQELVPQGALLGYLDIPKNQKALTANNYARMKLFAAQVAVGMEYLAKVNFVHRDLATRNILVASDELVKISDFGLSRQQAAEDDYYTASAGGKWPVKWYAPESVYYGKFTSLSDVWSFGVTMWEIWNFGELPYGDKTGREVLEGIEKDERLEQRAIPGDVYNVMLGCWRYEKTARTEFSKLKLELVALLPDDKMRKKVVLTA